jgi:hypothetical protein
MKIPIEQMHIHYNGTLKDDTERVSGRPLDTCSDYWLLLVYLNLL